MRALTIRPGRVGPVSVDEMPEPDPADGPVLVGTLAVGVCGTDRELVSGDDYGAAPPGEDRLVLGHEAVGRVLAAPPDAGLAEGDLVVGMVRHPDPVPCGSCAVGEWDMCTNGRYTEHGIKGLHGFARERWRERPDRLVRLDPALDAVGVLLEPASVVAKAWEHVDRIGGRAHWSPRTVLVTGAGPVGLLAALLGAQRGLEVHVLDQATDGPKPALVAALGGTYHAAGVDELELRADVVVECTGAAPLVAGVLDRAAPGGVVCLTGVAPAEHGAPLRLGRAVVLGNQVLFGSVNANRRHYELAAGALAAADRGWLERLLTRRVPLERAAEALDWRPGDIKVVLEVAA